MMRMNLTYRDGSTHDSVQYDKWTELAEDNDIDLEKFVSLLLMVSVNPSPEAKAAFKAIMYILSMFSECDGIIRFSSNHYTDIDAANDAIASMLSVKSKNQNKSDLTDTSNI